MFQRVESGADPTVPVTAKTSASSVPSYVTVTSNSTASYVPSSLASLTVKSIPDSVPSTTSIVKSELISLAKLRFSCCLASATPVLTAPEYSIVNSL